MIYNRSLKKKKRVLGLDLAISFQLWNAFDAIYAFKSGQFYHFNKSNN